MGIVLEWHLSKEGKFHPEKESFREVANVSGWHNDQVSQGSKFVLNTFFEFFYPREDFITIPHLLVDTCTSEIFTNGC